MNKPAREGDPEMIVFAIMDCAEQTDGLTEMRNKLSEIDESLRNLVSPEAWELVIAMNEIEADYRLELVKIVLAMTGLRVSSDTPIAGLRGA